MPAAPGTGADASGRRLLGDQRGGTLLAVLIAVTVMGLTAGIAGSTWRTILQREREEELLFRGEQYRRAMAGYFAVGGGHPRRLEDLLKDTRTPLPTRHLRRLYADPMTGGPWQLVRDSAGNILGVRSDSALRPFKSVGFPEGYEGFDQAESYRDWEFVFQRPQVAPET